MRFLLSVLLFTLVFPAWAKPYVEIIGGDNAVKAHYDVEIADEISERRVGLMNREKMDEGAGMLFVFDPPQPATFWMMNTLIPLDMIFTNVEGVIIYIQQNAQPHDLRSHGPQGALVRYVLEVNGGQSEKNAIELGDRLAIFE